MSGSLLQIDRDLWHAEHSFRAFGIAVSTRMTVVRLTDGALWLHSPIPISKDLQRQIDALGPVRFIVAPNRYHHLYAGHALQLYREATLFAAPGLRRKRPDIEKLLELEPATRRPWDADLDEVFFDGVPILSESVWLHRASGTLIATDVLQCLSGDLPLSARLYGRLQGVRSCLAVPRTLRFTTRDRVATRRSVQAILQWPVKRAVIAHNVILDERDDVAGKVHAALETFLLRIPG
jgi:hypothetical protein